MCWSESALSSKQESAPSRMRGTDSTGHRSAQRGRWACAANARYSASTSTNSLASSRRARKWCWSDEAGAITAQVTAGSNAQSRIHPGIGAQPSPALDSARGSISGRAVARSLAGGESSQEIHISSPDQALSDAIQLRMVEVAEVASAPHRGRHGSVLDAPYLGDGECRHVTAGVAEARFDIGDDPVQLGL